MASREREVVIDPSTARIKHLIIQNEEKFDIINLIVASQKRKLPFMKERKFAQIGAEWIPVEGIGVIEDDLLWVPVKEGSSHHY